MKRFMTLILFAAAVLTSCDRIELAPEFSRSMMPYEIPAEGGDYYIKVNYKSTRSMYYYLEWEFRTVIDGKVVDRVNIPACKLEEFLTDDRFNVVIPPNNTNHLRPVVVEASYYMEHGGQYTDSDGDSFDGGFWTDWEPVCSSVQLRNINIK